MSSGEISRLSRSELSRLRAISAGPADRFNHAPLSLPVYGSRHLALDLCQMTHAEDACMEKVEAQHKVEAKVGGGKTVRVQPYQRIRHGKVARKPTEYLLQDSTDQLSHVTVYQRTSKGFAWKDVKAMLAASEVFDNNAVMIRIVGKSVRTVQRLGSKMPANLTAQQSAVAYQYAKTLEDATRVFGSQDLAERWLCTPCKFLGGDVPLDMIDNPIGFQAVEDYLERMEYGVYQ